MNIFKNSLNIPDLYINEDVSNTTIVFAYLFATNEKFRNSKKQSLILDKYIDTLQEKVFQILDKNSSLKKKLIKFNNNIAETFKERYSEQFNKDFIFISQTIIEPKVFFIIYNDDKFNYDFDVSSLKSESKLIILNKVAEDYFPIQYDSSYVFYKDNNILDIIFTFYQKTKLNATEYEIKEDDVDNKLTEYTHIHVINDDDIIFEEFEDDLKIVYKNKEFNQSYSDEEVAIHVQNLLVRMKNTTDSAIYVDLFKQNSLVKDVLFFPTRFKVANVEKHVDEEFTYIDEFCNHKKNFPTRPFIKSIYYQNEQNKHNLLHDEIVIRNSMTSSFKLINNDVEINDLEDCMSMFKKTDLDVIAKKYDIAFSNSKKKLCERLLSHNFIESEVIQYYEDNMSLQELKQLAEKNNVVLPKSASKTKAIEKLLHARAITDVHTKKILSEEDIQNIIDKYNLPKFDDDEQTYTSLMYSNLLNLYSKQETDDKACVDELSPDIVLEPYQRENVLDLFYNFKSLKEDQLGFNGFFQIGNIHDKTYEIFNVSNYLNILNNLRKFLPLKCELHYNTSEEVINGKVINYEQNDKLLKIKANNKFVYYNLLNVKENDFFLYTELHEGFKFNKKQINKNIFFEFEKETYEEVIDIVSLNIPQYIEVFKPKLDSLNEISYFLRKFNTTLYNLNQNDYAYLFGYISTLDLNSKLENFKIPETKIEPEKKSIHMFLQFTNDNISDIHKMFKLQQNTSFFKFIHNTNIDISKSHTPSTLDTKVEFKKNTDSLQVLPPRTLFSSFEELNAYKQEVNKIIDKNNDILLTIRESEVQTYLKNKGAIWDTYSQFMTDVSKFKDSIHEKTFLTELTYKIEESQIETPTNTFVNSDPNVKHTSLTTNTVVKDDVLSNILKLVGLELSDVEVKYIYTEANNRYLPILKVYKQQKTNKKSVADNVLWTNYSLITIYSAFITLFAQYKYKLNNVFKPCKDMFSLEGFPLNDNEKSFINYISCIVHSIFSKSNAYFKSENFLATQINAIIKLIFQQNKALKAKFDNIAKKDVINNKNEVLAEQAVHMKPYKDDAVVLLVKDNLSNNLILKQKGFGIYKTFQNNYNEFDGAKVYQIICNKPKLGKNVLMDKIGKIRKVEPKKKSSHEKNNNYLLDVEINVKTIDAEISDYVRNFQKFFGFKINNFVEEVVEQFDKNVNFYYIFKLNTLFMKLKETYDFFANKSKIFDNNRYTISTDIQYNLLTMFQCVEKLCQELFDTEHIYTFMNTEMNADKRKHMTIFMNAFEEFLNNLTKKISNNLVDVEKLKKKTEILREEEKQEKLTKYNNLEDDEMYIIMELEKTVGIKIDLVEQVDNNNNEDVDTNFVPSQEDEDED
jgi:hypothetical protein